MEVSGLSSIPSTKKQEGDQESDDQLVIDNSALMMERIAQLYADRLLSDLTLIVGKKKYNAHRLILCTSSDVFQVMLMNPSWTESQGNVITLNEEEECASTFPDFLKYLYTGKISISHNNVLPLLILSDKYNVPDLIKLSVDYMNSHIVKGAMNGKLVSWLNYSMDCSHEELACSCLNFIAWNFELMANQDRDFALIDIRTMMDLLARDDLVVRDELTLFTCVSRWLFAQEKRMRRPGCSLTPSEASSDRRPGCSLTPSETSSDRRRSSPTQFTVDPESVDEVFESLVKEIMTLIRFPMMSPIELANLLIDPLVSRFKGFLVDQMAAAMVYHNLHAPPSCMSHQRSSPVPTSHNLASSNLSIDNPRKKRKHLNSCDDKSLIPRLYTNEKWSASLITDNYSSVPAYGTRTLMFQTPATLFQDDKNSSYPRRGSSPSFTTSPTPSSNPNSTFNTYQTPTYQQTPSSHYNEWAIDLHPKGLWFKAFKLIVWHGTLDCPEVVIKSVRLSVTSIHARNEKVKIGILVFGRQEGVDFVKQITTTVHTFTGEQNMININDLIPYESLNVPLSDQLIYRPRSSQVTMSNKSGFLIGPRNDTFKIHVVITPLTNY